MNINMEDVKLERIYNIFEGVNFVNSSEEEDFEFVDIIQGLLPLESATLILKKEVASNKNFLIAFKSFIDYSCLSIDNFYFGSLDFLESFFGDEFDFNNFFFLSFKEQQSLFIFLFFFFSNESLNHIRNSFLYCLLPSQESLGKKILVFDFVSFFFSKNLYINNRFSKFSVSLLKGNCSISQKLRFSKRSTIVGSFSLIYDFLRLPVLKLIFLFYFLAKFSKV